MITRSIPLAFALLFSSVAAVNASTGKLSDGYDVRDLDVPPISYSAVTVAWYEAIAVAVPELRKFSLALNKYKSVHIRETYKYIYVVFTANEVNSPEFGTPPGYQPGIEIQILKESMRVIGTRQE